MGDFDLVPIYCEGCDEEYQLPEDISLCPICGFVLEEVED